MNFKKTKVAVASGLMAASMVLAPLAAYATENVDPTTIGAEGKITVSKTVNVPAGVTIDSNVDFSVTQVANTDGVQAPNETKEGNVSTFTALNGVTGTHTFTTKDKTDASTDDSNQEGDFKYETSTSLDFSQVNAPGEYTFDIVETGKGTNTSGATPTGLKVVGTDNKYGWTVDSTKYVLRVYVTGTGSKSYTMQKCTKNDQGEYVPDENKNETASFTNTFTKRGNEDNGEENASLVIEKKVTANDYVDPNAEFEFTIKFEADQNSPAQVPEEISATMPEGNTSWEKSSGENTYTFKLKKDESVSFADLPAGIHYTVTESDFTNKQSTTNIATSNNIGKQSAEGETTGKQLIGENVNSAEFTNTFKGITITGVVTHSAPFVIMVGALFVAVGGYVVLKKRIEE